MRSYTATATPERGALPRERARPLLGTIVRIRVGKATAPDAAIDAAFAEIAAVHRLMSFQETTSDLARIGRAGAGEHVPLDPRTRACLAAALGWAARSDGAFDPVAVVGSGATWPDVTLDETGVCLARPLRLDLSGIAKGYAVDRACAVLAAHGVARVVIEAGGDLRVMGDAEEEVALRPGIDAPPATVTIAEGALASSDPSLAVAQAGAVAHRDGRTGRALAGFVTVAAPTCTDADALTKIVLALGTDAVPLLRSVGAVAYRCDENGWSTLGGAG